MDLTRLNSFCQTFNIDSDNSNLTFPWHDFFQLLEKLSQSPAEQVEETFYAEINKKTTLKSELGLSFKDDAFRAIMENKEKLLVYLLTNKDGQFSGNTILSAVMANKLNQQGFFVNFAEFVLNDDPHFSFLNYQLPIASFIQQKQLRLACLNYLQLRGDSEYVLQGKITPNLLTKIKELLWSPMLVPDYPISNYYYEQEALMHSQAMFLQLYRQKLDPEVYTTTLHHIACGQSLLLSALHQEEFSYKEDAEREQKNLFEFILKHLPDDVSKFSAAIAHTQKNAEKEVDTYLQDVLSENALGYYFDRDQFQTQFQGFLSQLDELVQSHVQKLNSIGLSVQINSLETRPTQNPKVRI